MKKYLSAVTVLIFAITSIQSVKSETFYIVTTPGSPFCNVSAGSESGHGAMNESGRGQQCLTLPQFVTKFISKELSPTNLTLELEPGEHILDSNLTMTTVVSFAMISEAATINCTSPIYRFFHLHSLENVLISGITFMDCGQIGVFNADHFRFENSSFQVIEYDNPLSYSLALESIIDIAIIGSTFSQNNNNVLYMENGSTVHIQHCTFSHLKNSDRAIYSVNSRIIIIDSSTLEEITSDSYYGESNGTVVEIMNNKESVTLENCDFTHNAIGNGSYALISIDGHGSIMVHSNRFTQNTGRVLHINSVNETTIDHNSFVDNTGPGVALDINAKSVLLKISGNNFTRNTDGAVNLLVSDSTVTVSDCTFSNNTKSKNGGAAMTVYEHDDVYHGYGSNILKISQSSFFNNSANINGSGGALHIRVDSTPFSEVTINSSIFSHNHAQQAGAVYIKAPANCTFGINVTTFDNNMATEGHAGAVAIEGEIQSSVFIINGTFTNNTAPHSYAGAVYIDAADTLMTGSMFFNNSAQNCGAFALNFGYIEIQVSTFLSNGAETDGGVICAYSGMNKVRILTGNFSYNRAGGSGGVLITQPLADGEYGNRSIHFLIDIDESSFDHNMANSQGGVFATFAQSEFQIGSSSFFNNEAGIEGGVMYVQDTNSSVSILLNSQLGFNRATKRGGIISINGSSLFIGSARIFNNSADMGAVISACNSDVGFFPPDMLYQYNDPNSPNCLLYDVAENRPTTADVTTPTIPPTRAKYSNGIAIAVAVPIGCLLLALIVAAALVFAYMYWRGYLKCKKPVSVGRYGIKKSESYVPEHAPLMDNA